MNDEERFLFDLQGFITVPDALSGEQIGKLNEVWDEHIARENSQAFSTKRWGSLLTWGGAYQALIDNPRIAPYLQEIVNPIFRLDHDYADLIRPAKSGPVKGPIGATLHGGATPFDPAQYYHFQNGRMYSGLVVVAYNLRDVGESEGGFGCVPGSHKSNYPFPSQWCDLDAGLQPFMRAVTGPAGMAIIFTEALTHGTLPWRGQGERRTIFMKYSPHPLSWAAGYYRADQYENLTEQQEAILEPPNARNKGRTVAFGRV